MVFATAANTMSGSSDMKASFAFGFITAFAAGCMVIANYIEGTRRRLNEGKGTLMEGILLGSLLLMNAVAVSLMTKVGGVAYSALNLYYGAWLMFVASFLAFNDWMLHYASFSAQQVRKNSI